jgi:hypothetical protein
VFSRDTDDKRIDIYLLDWKFCIKYKYTIENLMIL